MKIKFCLICIFLCVTFLTNAQNNFKKLFVEAEQKVEQKKYVEAAVIYERIIFSSPDDSITFTAIIKKIYCYKLSGNYHLAYSYIQNHLNSVTTDSLKYQLYEQWITCSYLSNKLEHCISLIEQAKVYFPLFYNENRLTFLAVLCLNEQQKWKEASILLNNWLQKNNIDTSLNNYYTAIPKLKSAKKAEALATFLPGVGHFYANKPLEGITSLLLQAVGVYYGITNFKEKYYFSSWLVGFGFAGSFHFGGVRRVEDLVRIYNTKKCSNYNNMLRNKIINLMQPYL